jgi:hypothetical protein
MLVLFTDFGGNDLYVGQLKAALAREAPRGMPVVDLLHDAPAFSPLPSAHLLDALRGQFAPGTVFVCVVDPGVGSDRLPVVVEADGQWYVGPDNGLLSVVAARADRAKVWRIVWRPGELSASFHGRDLFAPLAGRIAAGNLPAGQVIETDRLEVRLGSGDLPEVIYIDHFGNAITGLRAAAVSSSARIAVRGLRLAHARVFAEVPAGTGFWYTNSIGLVELAANRASIAAQHGLAVGDPLSLGL